MRKLDIAFAVALILIVILFGTGLLVVQRYRNIAYCYKENGIAIPMPGWTKYPKNGTSA